MPAKPVRDLIHLNGEEVRSLLPAKAAVEALRHFHTYGTMPITDRQVIRDRESANTFTALTAWNSGQFIAVKLNGSFPGNPDLPAPQPAIQGLVALFDGSNGRALMTCDGAALTQVKTAADSALAVDLLSRKDSSTYLLVGAGALANEFVVAMREVRPSVERILIWNRSEGRAENLAATLRRTGIHCEVVSELTKAVAKADIISALTMSKTPIIFGDHVKSGAHVDLVGSYLPEMREGDDALITRSGRIYVDTRAHCVHSGDISQPLASGVLTQEMIAGDLFELCGGQLEGRQGDSDVTVFKNIGGAHLDLAVAVELYRRAIASEA